jgi:hypothetical protein
MLKSVKKQHGQVPWLKEEDETASVARSGEYVGLMV